MIASTMLYLALVSLAATGAALLAEAGLRRVGVPRRWAWLAALALPVALYALALLPPLAPSLPGAVPTGVLVIPLEGLVVGGADGARAGTVLDAAAGAVWVIALLATLLVLLRGQRTLARERRGWRAARVLDEDVWISDERGPAVAGVLRSWIVLPEWLLRLDPHELRMVLAHEREHLRAGDPRLLGAALGLVALTPWNPLAWWQLGRLRAAMELDCDRRVLARERDARVYGSALLTVAGRLAPQGSLGLAAFSESAGSLERRITALSARRSRWSTPTGIVLLGFAVLVGVQACAVEGPTGPMPREQPIGDARPFDPETAPGPEQRAATDVIVETPPPAAPAPGADPSEQPYFTPFSVAPVVLNRDEVAAALESEYPALLRDAGVEGRAIIWLYLDEQGVVRNVTINSSSGHQALDLAALKVGRTMRFRPAMNRDEIVPVWVSIPVSFRARPAP